jgi:hypothetical protein
MSKQNIQDRSKCDNCYRAAKYGKPEWHNDCSKGRRFNKSTTNFQQAKRLGAVGLYGLVIVTTKELRHEARHDGTRHC